MTIKEAESIIKDILATARENTISPIVDYMVKALTDVFEAGVSAGLEISKRISDNES